MIILTLFGVLSLVVFGFLWFQYDRLSNILDIVELVDENTSATNKLGKVSRITLSVMKKFRSMLWIPAMVVLVLLFIISTILGGLITFIISFF
jgi:hypothetical protein